LGGIGLDFSAMGKQQLKVQNHPVDLLERTGLYLK
jgi:hypothetical protein